MFLMQWFGRSRNNPVVRCTLRFERLEARDVPAQLYAVNPVADQVPFLPAPAASGHDIWLVDSATTPPANTADYGAAAPAAVILVDEKDRPAPPEGVDPHKWELGWDPAKKKYVESEADTALRLEKQQDIKLKRYFPKDAKEKGDFVDEKGVIYDGCSPPKTEFFDKQLDNYKKSLDEHLAHPTVDKVVIDTTGLNLTEAQLKQIDDDIKSLPKDKQDKIVRIK